MAKSPTLLSLCFLISNLILILNNVVVNSNVLTIRLIHPHSSESPFFRSDLSHEKRIRMQTQLGAQNFQYIVKIGIGTFKSEPPYKDYYLEMDTGSSLVWIQCEGCTKCFNQTPKPFPKHNSSSFRPVLVDSKPIYYECSYADGASTKGMLARETFYLRSNTGGLAQVKNIQFGCGLHNDMQYGDYRNNKIAGIMGLGWDDLSFVKQLGPQFNGAFSYCLPVVSGKTASTFLRFGEDVAHRKNSRSTPLYRKSEASPYYVEMQGISVNKTRLKIKPEVFAFKNNGSLGGCIVDSGTPYSRIITPAFDMLKLELEKYFSRMKGLKKTKGNLGLELCYERKKLRGLNKLPEITFHLGGSHAEFVIKGEAVFEVFGQYFCLAMVRSDKRSIIGSY